jgi:hypothetical protein
MSVGSRAFALEATGELLKTAGRLAMQAKDAPCGPQRFPVPGSQLPAASGSVAAVTRRNGFFCGQGSPCESETPTSTVPTREKKEKEEKKEKTRAILLCGAPSVRSGVGRVSHGQRSHCYRSLSLPYRATSYIMDTETA